MSGHRGVAGPKPKPGLRGLTDELHEKIVDAVRAGNYMDVAARYAGVNQETFAHWLKLGRAGIREGKNNRHTRLAQALDEALAQAEVRDLALIGKAAEGQWQAAAWRLERKFPDRYGQKTRVEGTIKLQPVPLIDADKLTVDELMQLRYLLQKGQPNVDDPALSEQARPALELLPGGDLIDAEAAEV